MLIIECIRAGAVRLHFYLSILNTCASLFLPASSSRSGAHFLLSFFFFFLLLLLLFEPSLWYDVIFHYHAFGFLFSTVLIGCISDHITKTCLYNFNPLKPHFYTVKLRFTGVYIIFLISAQKHRLWVLVRTASPRRFLRVPTIYVLSRNMKNIRVFYLKTFGFWR